jgi:DNA replication protein DnaC
MEAIIKEILGTIMTQGGEEPRDHIILLGASGTGKAHLLTTLAKRVRIAERGG